MIKTVHYKWYIAGNIVQTVHGFNIEINMKFSLVKCTKPTVKSIKLVKISHIKFNKTTEIRELDQSRAYKYLVRSMN